MAAERVTEARVTNVCRYARKYGARKLLVSIRLDPPAIPPTPPLSPDARDGSTRVPFAHKVGKKPGTLTRRSPVTLGSFCSSRVIGAKSAPFRAVRPGRDDPESPNLSRRHSADRRFREISAARGRQLQDRTFLMRQRYDVI